jgi:lipopolysaccharide/colanic/teichoic acid biosynthesis glycosyltransferase
MRPGRIGKGGRVIRLLKLRTMLFDDDGDPELHAKNRVTTLGRFLRKTRIDELPQLWNVFTGELSFIGPRPEFPKIVEVYEREIPQYRMRHLIVPGLSGWAQIHDYDAPRGTADVVRTRRKFSFDLYYLKHRSFAVDLAVAMKSLRALLAFSGT